MSRVVEVLGFERVPREHGEDEELLVDAGDRDATRVQMYSAPGEDSPPLPGDWAHLVESTGTGGEAAVGFADDAPKLAAKGERRLVGRNASGEVVSWAWLKGDGSIVLGNQSGEMTMAPNGDVTVTGNLIVHGEVSANAALPATAVKLSTHLHPTGVGPSGSPTPGT